MLTHYYLSGGLTAVVHDITPKIVTPAPDPAVDHILVVDVSGSMSGELPRLREHLKQKVSQLMREQDTISIIWFSGRGEFGTLLEGTPVPDLRALMSVHQKIDRWLRPVGMTGFYEPLVELKGVLNRLSKNGKEASVYFLSDGCDNQWPRNKVIEAIEAVKNVASATVVEYGYYADRAFLAQMASVWGGAHVFAQNFDAYQPAFEKAVTRQVVGGARERVHVGYPEGGIVVALDRGNVVAYAVTESGDVDVPQGTTQVAYLIRGEKDDKLDIIKTKHDMLLYGLVSAFAPRVRSDYIWPLLRRLGDVRLIKAYGTCFGKQAYSDFQAKVTEAVFDENYRLAEGFNPALVPPEDAFTILDLLDFIQEHDLRIDFDSKFFEYQKIGRTRVDANTRLTEDEQEELKLLTEDLKSTADVHKLKQIQERIYALTNKPEPLIFKADKPEQRGYAVDGLVLNEDRPNVSFRVKRYGTVDLSGRLPDDLKGKLPATFPTFQYRNYTVIRDGIVNIKRLPVVSGHGLTYKLNEAFKSGRLSLEAVTTHYKDGEMTTVFDLTKIPIINQSMIKRLSAEEFFRTSWELLKHQAALKVYKHEHSERYDKKSEGFSALYGKEAAEWLTEQGIVSYSGFNPKTLQAESMDVYQAKVLEAKIKGYSSLPSVKEVMKRIEDKKALNGPARLMESSLPGVTTLSKEALEGFIKDRTREVRKQQAKLAEYVYGVIVGQSWFKEFKSLDENQLKLRLDGEDLQFTAELKETEVRV